MSPSRAGSSRSSNWRIFSLAWLVTYFASARNQKTAKNKLNFQFPVGDLFLIWKWINYAAKSYHTTLKTPLCFIKWLKSCKNGKFEIVILNQGLQFAIFWHTLCQYCQLGFSLEIAVPQLGSESSQLGLAWAGKFQLEPISSNFILQRIF